MKDILNQPLSVLKLSTRARNAVNSTLYYYPDNKECFTVKELLGLTVNELNKSVGVGAITIKEIRTTLLKHKLYLKGDAPLVFSEKTLKHLSDVHIKINCTIDSLGNGHPATVLELKKILKRVCILQNKIN